MLLKNLLISSNYAITTSIGMEIVGGPSVESSFIFNLIEDRRQRVNA